MRFTLKQKFFSLMGQEFTVRDEAGDVVYRVSGKVFSVGDKLTIKDASGGEVARIEQRVIALRPTYVVRRGDQVVATVKKRLVSFRDRFIIDIPDDDNLEATGSFLDYEYNLHQGRSAVAKVSKKWLSLTDVYGIEIDDDADPIVPLATTIIIDLLCHDKDKQLDV
ncbi:MAG: LURP-one-related family protein [Myxococcota bacterium]